MKKSEQKRDKDFYNRKLYELFPKLEISDPKKMNFIKSYVETKFQMSVEDDALNVIEDRNVKLLILLIYDILSDYDKIIKKL